MKNIYFHLSVILIVVLAQKGCAQKGSEVHTASFNSSLINDEINYQVYLPPSYNDRNEYPVVYLLHGHGGDEKDWFQSGEGNVKSILDSLITSESIPPVVAASMDAGNSWYVDRHLKMESTYITEFLPLIESNYAINANRQNRFLAGNSAGGYGGLNFSIKYPELFKASILLSPAAYYPAPPLNSSSRKIDVFSKSSTLLDTSIWQSYAYPNLFTSIKPNQLPDMYISTGDHDEYEIVTVVTDLRSFLIANNIPQELTIIDGDHTWDVWKKCFAQDLVRAFKSSLKAK